MAALPFGVAPDFELFDAFAVELLFLGIAMFLAIGALSREQERPFSASLVHLALGLIAAMLIEAFDVTWIEPIKDASVLEHLTELALVVALFGAGLKMERPLRIRTWRTVILLLALVMPLTVALVAAYGALAMGLPVGAAIASGGSSPRQIRSWPATSAWVRPVRRTAATRAST